ncbi:MAG: hypothetical protein ACTSVV_07410, partial [Promethearchaeota archaeon]
KIFLNLPRYVIDLTIDPKYAPLLLFLEKYPRLDYNQLNDDEKEITKIKEQIAKAYAGLSTGNNDIFVKFWFEVPIQQIREYKPIETINELSDYKSQPFIPYTKGGGDFQYYLQNSFIIWWNKESIKEMKKFSSSLSNIRFQGLSDLNWSKLSGKPRGRFTIAQKFMISDDASKSIIITNKNINKYYLIAYLNSKFITYFGRLQTKGRRWPIGTVARFPIPNNLNKQDISKLAKLAKESYQLRQYWDTNYPMSPIFIETLIDRVISFNGKEEIHLNPKTKHPFCNEYKMEEYLILREITQINLNPHSATLNETLEKCEQRFRLLIGRLDEIDIEINKILYQLIDKETQEALDDYYNKFVGDLEYLAEPDIWLQDFLMVNLMDIIKKTPNGFITFQNIIAGNENSGLYERFIQLLCKKFDRNEHELQPILTEIKEILGKPLKKWIKEDFFFYHTKRFGARPIIWQITSKTNPKFDSTIDIFIDYQQLKDTTLGRIRVDVLQPLLNRLENQKEIGILNEEEFFKCNELDELIKKFIEIEKGYPSLPSPNSLMGSKSQAGLHYDKTWGIIFSEALKIIKQGYKPDLSKGVLINLIPLCLDLPDKEKDKYSIKYHSITPKGTLKNVLKKLSALDQLKQVSVNEKKQKK